MKQIISAGIIIFRKSKEGLKFLLLYHGRNYWNFPKGKLEQSERSAEAALREVKEETGLKAAELRMVWDFRTKERFTYRRGVENIFKVVILFLAETRQATITVSEEHEGYGWFTYYEAKKILSKHKDSVKILENAHQFLLQKSRPPHRLQNPTRTGPHVSGSGAPSEEPKSVSSSGEHPKQEHRPVKDTMPPRSAV